MISNFYRLILLPILILGWLSLSLALIVSHPSNHVTSQNSHHAPTSSEYGLPCPFSVLPAQSATVCLMTALAHLEAWQNSLGNFTLGVTLLLLAGAIVWRFSSRPSERAQLMWWYSRWRYVFGMRIQFCQQWFLATCYSTRRYMRQPRLMAFEII